MDIYPSTDTPESLTTDEVLAGCRAAGIRVTKVQLSRWARAGLLDHPQSSGRGRGKGWQWLWKAETLPRARLIARALTPQKSARTPSPRGRSFERAADLLMYKGYAPRSDVLRQRLQTLLDWMEHDATRYQTYLADQDLPEQERRARFVTALERRLHVSEPQNAQVASTLSVLAAIAVGFTDLARFFSFQALREALNASEADELTRAYALATELSTALPPEFDAFLDSLAQLLPSPRDSRRRRLPAALEAVESWREVARPMFTIGLLAFYHHAAEMRAHLMALGPTIARWEQTLGLDKVLPSDATIEQSMSSWQWLLAPLMLPGNETPKTETGPVPPDQASTVPSSQGNEGGETPTM